MNINNDIVRKKSTSNFYFVSLHSMLEHLSLNLKNIRKLLRYMTNYIRNKSIEPNKVNDVPDLKRVGEVAWNFVSALYGFEWDLLVSDKDN